MYRGDTHEIPILLNKIRYRPVGLLIPFTLNFHAEAIFTSLKLENAFLGNSASLLANGI